MLSASEVNLHAMTRWPLSARYSHSAFNDEATQTGAEKILIVDDEKDLVDLAAYHLKGKGDRKDF